MLPRDICTLVQTCMNPTWKAHHGTSKDEIKRPHDPFKYEFLVPS